MTFFVFLICLAVVGGVASWIVYLYFAIDGLRDVLHYTKSDLNRANDRALKLAATSTARILKLEAEIVERLVKLEG
jgi:hypothetical protein